MISRPPSSEHPGTLNWFLVIALGVVWGTAFMSVRLALEGFGPISVAAWRCTIGALVLTACAVALGQGPGQILANGGKRGLGFVAGFGLISTAMPFLLLSWGQQHIPSAFAGVAMGAGPLLVLLLVAVFSPEEGIGPRRVAGMVIGFVGLVVLIGPGALEGGGSDLQTWGQLACIGAASGYAVGSIMTRRAPKMPQLAFASGSLITASVVLLPVALMVEGLPTIDLSRPKPLYALLYAALLPTALASVIRVRVITTAGSLFMSLTSYMVPVWSVIFGIAIMSEDLPQGLYWGLALILLGIGVSQSRALFRRP